jgi:hypothetical protein
MNDFIGATNSLVDVFEYCRSSTDDFLIQSITLRINTADPDRLFYLREKVLTSGLKLIINENDTTISYGGSRSETLEAVNKVVKTFRKIRESFECESVNRGRISISFTPQMLFHSSEFPDYILEVSYLLNQIGYRNIARKDSLEVTF